MLWEYVYRDDRQENEFKEYFQEFVMNRSKK